MSRSKRTLILVSAVCLVFASVAQGQTQASCIFQNVPATYQVKYSLAPSNINDWSTIVGGASTITNAFSGGFIRWANGSIQINGTHLVDRNDNGATLGWNPINGEKEPVIITGPITTPSIVVASVQIGQNFVSYYTPTAINDWTSVVGYYNDSSNIFHGLERWSNRFVTKPSDSVGLCTTANCSGIQLDYPGASASGAFSGTFPTAINDHGTIVGYEGLLSATHGFIYSSGNWAKLDYPGSNVTYTELSGIANDRTIVGFANLTVGSLVSFIYRNGTFKTITFPNSQYTAVVGISLKTDIIIGEALGTDSVLRAFTAKCN